MYTDFGETSKQGDTNFYNEICYTGGVYDASTGLYYLNARYYNPEDGRFLTHDTYRGSKEKINTWHLYTYCANNPISYKDPSGHFFIIAIFGWTVADWILVGATAAVGTAAIAMTVETVKHAGIRKSKKGWKRKGTHTYNKGQIWSPLSSKCKGTVSKNTEGSWPT